MTNLGGSGLQQLGINPMPCGTLEELEALNIDPQSVASCHPSRPGVVRGCPLWRDCRFHLKQYGGFKGKTGPHYVGYFLQTNEGHKKEDFISCHGFVRVLQARMDTGVQQRQKGDPRAEIIRIIAQEGEKIVTRVARPVDAKGEPTKEGDIAPAAAYKYFTDTIEVPRMPRPGENEQITYDEKLTARELARQQAEQDVQDQAFEAARAATPDGHDDLMSDDPPEIPLAEPVLKGKK